MIKPRSITITPVMNGFVVNVGCQSVVLDSVANLVEAINAYYTDPEQTTRRYLASRINDTMDSPVPLTRPLWDGEKFPEPCPPSRPYNQDAEGVAQCCQPASQP
jgi:hypothetical protein